jgi:GNAT superfamily N-acetyltransferase
MNRDGRNAGDRPLPRGLSVRRGTAEDESPTFDVMRRTMNADMNWQAHAATRHHLRNSANCSFWVAEEAPRFGSPRVVGYARSVVRDKVWSLTEFFVLPSQHRQGLGRRLLGACIEDGEAAGADTRMVLASHHPDADSLYIRRAGCLPLVPMMLLGGSSLSLKLPEGMSGSIADTAATGLFNEVYTGSVARSSVIAEPLTANDALINELSVIDREIVGFARPSEHRLWIQEMGGHNGTSRLFRAAGDGRILGYSYMGPLTNGPSLALDPQQLPRYFYHVSQLTRARYSATAFDLGFGDPSGMDQYAALSGVNGVMLNWLLQNRWQIMFQYLFMASRPFGKHDRYVCHNPLYVL